MEKFLCLLILSKCIILTRNLYMHVVSNWTIYFHIQPRSFTKKRTESPFYPGRVTYGGASSISGYTSGKRLRRNSPGSEVFLFLDKAHCTLADFHWNPVGWQNVDQCVVDHDNCMAKSGVIRSNQTCLISRHFVRCSLLVCGCPQLFPDKKLACVR